MTLTINGPITNGMIDFIRDANEHDIGTFIFGAFGRGYTVSIPGTVRVIFSKWTIYTHNKPDAKVYFFYGNACVYETPLEGFRWSRYKLTANLLYEGTTLVGKGVKK